MCQQSCTRADLLLDEDGAPRRRSTESGERDREREREPGPPRRRRAAVSCAMAVSARRAPRRTEFGFPVLPRRRVCAAHPLGVRSSLTGATSRSPPRVRRRRLGTCILASGDFGAASSRWVGRPHAGLVSKSRPCSRGRSNEHQEKNTPPPPLRRAVLMLIDPVTVLQDLL